MNEEPKTYSAQIRSTTKLNEAPDTLLTNPMTGGITAPPTTAMIIKADISFERSGSLVIVSEKTSGKRFPETRPINAIETIVRPDDGEKINKMMNKHVSTVDQTRKEKLLTLASNKAPKNRLIIRAKK